MYFSSSQLFAGMVAFFFQHVLRFIVTFCGEWECGSTYERQGGCSGIRKVGFCYKPLPYSDKPCRACQDASLATATVTARAVNALALVSFKYCLFQGRDTRQALNLVSG
jgi:hypothetical protein